MINIREGSHTRPSMVFAIFKLAFEGIVLNQPQLLVLMIEDEVQDVVLDVLFTLLGS